MSGIGFQLRIIVRVTPYLLVSLCPPGINVTTYWSPLYNSLITLISIWLWIMITLSQLTMTGLSLLSLSWTTDLAPLWASLLSQSRVYTVQVYSAVQLTVHLYSFSLSSALAVWPLARNINYVECGFGGEHEMFLVLPQNIGLSGDFIMAFLSIKVLTETDR